MPVKVQIPTALEQYVGRRDSVQVLGETVGEAVANLAEQYPELRRHLMGENGHLRCFVNLYVNDEDVRGLQRDSTPLHEDDVLTIVPSLAGGAPAIAEETGVELSNDEVARYSRHLIMPEVGTEGQKKLKAASVLLVGTGGLGAPLGMYLAAAGVGRLGLVDLDVVDFSNLQRQIIHGTKDVGRSKLASASDRIRDINPFVQLDLHETMLSSENALEIGRNYDIIIDGTDNFPTRYLVNDTCVLLGKPNVYGSIFRFDGQASVFWAEKGPCYRCLYPEPPPPGLVPSCAEGGVLGVLPGIIGAIQANEAIKLILGKGEPLIGRLLLFDAMQMKFRELKLRKDPNCPLCGEHPTITHLIDYEQFCGIPKQAPAGLDAEWEITPRELKARLDRGDHPFILDVRNPEEWQIARLNGAHLIPLNELSQRYAELDRDQEIILHCKSGKRSQTALEFLRDQAGFRKLKNLKGGIDAWAVDVDPSVPRY